MVNKCIIEFFSPTPYTNLDIREDIQESERFQSIDLSMTIFINLSKQATLSFFNAKIKVEYHERIILIFPASLGDRLAGKIIYWLKKGVC